MLLTLIHNRLANSVILYLLVMMVWSLWRYFRKEGANSNFRGAVVISEILILVQSGMGGILWLSNLRPERGGMHVLYGIVGILGIPSVFAFTKGRQSRYEMLVYGVAYLCLLGIILRSMATG